MIKHTLFILVSSVLLGIIPPIVHAQLSYLDKTTLIDTLAKEGMAELLTHMAQTVPPDDPVFGPLIQVAQLRITYADPKRPRPEQLAAFDQMADVMRRLIAAHRDHEQRPVWQTDFASMLLFDYLQGAHQVADLFYLFGVPTADQRQAFESVVPEAYEQLVDADLRFFQLVTDLPRQGDHTAKRVHTGLWDRMTNEYYKTKTRFLLAQAGYYTSRLNNDHSYFQHLGNPKIPRQQQSPQEERHRLIASTIDALDDLPADDHDPFQIRQTSLCLLGRAMLDQDRLDEAIQKLDTVIHASQNDQNQLVAQLAKAIALSKNDQEQKAQQLLADLEHEPMAKQNLLFRLLIVDLDHRLKLAKALAQTESTQLPEITKAYEPYERLLSDPSLGDDVAGLKNYIYARWESLAKPDENLSLLPDTVLAATGQMARIRGQALVYQADQLDSQADQEQRVVELVAQAQPMLDRAILINTELLKRTTLAPRIRASAKFNLGMAKYFLAQGDPDGMMEAAKILTELADQFPDQPVAEEAITTAIAVLRQLLSMQPRPQDAVEAYDQSAQALFGKFPTTQAADNERVYYAFYVLAASGRYAQAVELLGKAPKNHPLYFEAQREMVINLKKVFNQAEKVVDKDMAQKRLLANAERLIDEAKAVSSNDDAQLFQDARNAHGTAKLILIDMAIAQNDVDQALAQLEGFDEAFKDEPNLVRQALTKGIVVLAQAGKFGPLVTRAKKMMGMFPDDAAAVIDGVLADLTQTIDQLRADAQRSQVQREKEQMVQRAEGLAQAAQMLAELLLDWAIRQNFDKTDLVPFKLLMAKAARLAGQFNVALDTLKPLLSEYPDDTDLIFHTAQTLFALGDEQSLIDAAQKYDRLIVGVSPPYPPIWWQAWLNRLQIMDRLNQSVQDIPLRVRALELTDPNLGGEPYRTQLKQLQLKHTR